MPFVTSDTIVTEAAPDVPAPPQTNNASAEEPAADSRQSAPASRLGPLASSSTGAVEASPALPASGDMTTAGNESAADSQEGTPPSRLGPLNSSSTGDVEAAPTL